MEIKLKINEYLQMLQEEIHSTVIATVDEHGNPQTRVIDIMLTDENGIYFLTAKGKDFYKQLINKNFVAISGMTNGSGTMNKKSISVRGKVKNIGQQYLKEILEKNLYMYEIYPNEESRIALEVFCLYQGEGEFFDLSTKPITRHNFVIGDILYNNGVEIKSGYYINGKCIGCRICYSKCPQKCIIVGKPSTINHDNCLHCGNCKEFCPVGAVEKF